MLRCICPVLEYIRVVEVKEIFALTSIHSLDVECSKSLGGVEGLSYERCRDFPARVEADSRPKLLLDIMRSKESRSSAEDQKSL